MPNKQAALKDLRKNRRAAVRNARVKTNVKALFKQVKELSANAQSAEFKAALSKFQQAVDKAAKTGVVSRKAAGHRKSSLMKLAAVKK